jgi:hypothetical protein
MAAEYGISLSALKKKKVSIAKKAWRNKDAINKNGVPHTCATPRKENSGSTITC